MLKIVCSIFLWIWVTAEGRVLDSYIQHYEELRYDPQSLHQSHLRAKRSATNPSLNLKFKAFGRDFDLQLEKAKSIFTSDHKLRHTNGSTEEVDTSFIYEGRLKDIKGSFVHGAVIEGVFRGFVDVPGDTTYHIEHSRRFFGNGHPVHSIIYSEKHVNLDPYKHKREKGRGTCGVDLHEDWMHKHSQPQTEKQSTSKHAREQYFNLYTKDQQDVHKVQEKERLIRRKRETLGTKNTCYMYMRSDPVLHNHLKKNGVTDEVAKDEILALFSAHVAAINKIYGNTKFSTYNGAKSYEGVHFQVQRTTIMTDVTENCNNIQAGPYCNPNIDVSNFLNLNSLTNHNEFCLAYVFTARDFTQGTLGLAWVGSSKNAAGGICEKWKEFREGATKVYKSLNTGIVTIVNYGKQVAPRVSHLTFAHECGHNFGSPHDSGPKCAPYNTNYPGASDGNYIMYASATQGDLPHNSEFSDCSKDNISLVLDEVIKGSKNNCFKESGVQFCGNGLVEGDEECDCGFEEDCTDKCCNPKKSGTTTGEECKLRRRNNGNKYECSPTRGPCCTKDCEFVTASSHTMCRVGTECVKAANCSGTNASCPEPDNYPDILTFCNDKSLVCENGMCTGSLCKRVGYTKNKNVSLYDECFKSVGNSDQKEGLCYLSCKKKDNGTCLSSADGDKIQDEYFRTMLMEVSGTNSADKVKLPAGSPCNNYKGYCDVFHRCRGIDNDGPLARLKNLIFNEETLTNIVNFLSEYWWGVMLCCIGLIILMAVFIKVCAVHTPSSNPKAKPALKITDTLRRRRRPQQQNNQQQPLQQYSNQQYPVDQGPPPPYPGPSAGGPKRGHRDKGKQQMKKNKV